MIFQGKPVMFHKDLSCINVFNYEDYRMQNLLKIMCMKFFLIGHKRGKYFCFVYYSRTGWEKGGIMLDSDPEVDNRFLELVSAWP